MLGTAARCQTARQHSGRGKPPLLQASRRRTAPWMGAPHLAVMVGLRRRCHAAEHGQQAEHVGAQQQTREEPAQGHEVRGSVQRGALIKEAKNCGSQHNPEGCCQASPLPAFQQCTGRLAAFLCGQARRCGRRCLPARHGRQPPLPREPCSPAQQALHTMHWLCWLLRGVVFTSWEPAWVRRTVVQQTRAWFATRAAKPWGASHRCHCRGYRPAATQ